MQRALIGHASLLVAALVASGGCGARMSAIDSVRTAGPASGVEWYFQTSDRVRHYVYEVGHGDPIVVLHGGFGAEHSYLLPAVTPMSSRHRFVLYDQRGSLRTPAADSTISLGSFVADLEELRRQLGLEKMTLLAHSMGSAIAYAYLREHPQHVRGIVLTGAVLPEGFALDSAKRSASERAFADFAEANDRNEARRQGLDREGLVGREWTNRWRISYASGALYRIERWKLMLGGQAFYNGRIGGLVFKNTPAEERTAALNTLQTNPVPLEVIMGDHDLSDFGLVFWPELVTGLPNAHLTRIRNAGHAAWIDQPEAWMAAIESALEGIRKGVRR